MAGSWTSVGVGSTTGSTTTTTTTTAQRFDRLVPNSLCRLVDINEHLLCALCSGYLVDATTIIECLHTFCRSCIIRYLESSETCPVCDVPLHQTNPLLGIRSDTTIQTLVYKLVPGVYKDEVKRRCAIINNAHTDERPASTMDRLLKDICDMTTGGTIYTGDERFSVCLQYCPSTDSTYSPNCSSNSSNNSSSRELGSMDGGRNECEMPKQDLTDCSYLLCPASLTVAHLKKLIRNKLELSSEHPLELYHSSRDGSLDDSYSLADVAYITAWTSVKPLHFLYCVNVRRSQGTGAGHSHSQPRPLSSEADRRWDDAGSKRDNNAPRNHSSQKTKHTNRSPSNAGGVSKPKVKPPPGKCLPSTKAFAVQQNIFSSQFKVKKKTKPQPSPPPPPPEKPDRVTMATDVTSDEARKAISPEEDTLENYPIQTDSLLLPVATTNPECDVTRAFGDVTTRRDVNDATPKRVTVDCVTSVDSALSPSHPDIVSQSTLPSPSHSSPSPSDTVSDGEDNSATSTQPTKNKDKKTGSCEQQLPPNDRNLFAVINSMIVTKSNNNNTASNNNNNNNNDNVVSSSTSSQVSADDCSDSGTARTSVETQTNVKLMTRKTKKVKVKARSMKKTNEKETVKPSSSKNRHINDDDVDDGIIIGGSSGLPDTTPHAPGPSVSVEGPSTSGSFCVPICSSLILSLPQNVSLQCRIRSDKIVIASGPTTDSNPEPEVVVPPATDGTSTPASIGYPPRISTVRTGTEGGSTGTEAISDDLDKRVNDSGTVLLCQSTDSAVIPADNATDTHRKDDSKLCQVSRDSQQVSDLKPRDQDSVSIPTNAISSAALKPSTLFTSLPSNAGSHSDANTVVPLVGATSTDVSPNGVAAKHPALPVPQKLVPKQKPVQSVLPNVSKISTAPPDANTHHHTPTTPPNKVVLFKPYQMPNTTTTTTTRPSKTVSHVDSSPEIQYSIPPTTGHYPPTAPQFPVFPGFTRSLGSVDDDPKYRGHLIGDEGVVTPTAEQKSLKASMHCTAGNIPLRNVIRVPVYTAGCTRKSKPDRKQTQGSKVVPGLIARFNQEPEQVVRGVDEEINNRKTDEESRASLKQASKSQSTETLKASLSLPLAGFTISSPGGADVSTAPLAVDCETPKKTNNSSSSSSLKRQHLQSGSPELTPKHSPRRRSERSSAELTFTTRAEADSGTSPGSVAPSPPRCASSKGEGGGSSITHHCSGHRSGCSSPVRKKLVIDLERCRSTETDTRRPGAGPQCCSPSTTLPPPPPPPAKLVISLPRCQVPPTASETSPQGQGQDGQGHWSPPSSTTTKRLKLMCNGMTIYRTLESPGSRSGSSSGSSGSSGSKKSPASAPVSDSPRIPLFSPDETTTAAAPKTPSKSRRKGVSQGVPPAPVTPVPSRVDSTSASPRAVVPIASGQGGSDHLFGWKGVGRSLSLPDQEPVDGPLELTTKVVKERQMEREYEKLMSSLRPPSAFTT